jgi:hypothetical protein
MENKLLPKYDVMIDPYLVLQEKLKKPGGMRMTVNSAHGGVRYEPHLRSYHKV